MLSKANDKMDICKVYSVIFMLMINFLHSESECNILFKAFSSHLAFVKLVNTQLHINKNLYRDHCSTSTITVTKKNDLLRTMIWSLASFWQFVRTIPFSKGQMFITFERNFFF